MSRTKINREARAKIAAHARWKKAYKKQLKEAKNELLLERMRSTYVINAFRSKITTAQDALK